MPSLGGALPVEPARRGGAAGRAEEDPVAERPGHLPVLLDETLARLAPRGGDVVVDATLGQAGHAEALLEAIGPRGRLYGIDRDPAALEAAARRLERFGRAFVPLHGDHREVVRLLGDAGVERADRVLFDLGISSVQLGDAKRGFSFSVDGPLDMRMDPGSGRTAAELLADFSEDDLARTLWRFGEERRSRAIARAIVRRREQEPLRTTAELAGLVERVAGPAARRFRIHPATRTFQALRIAVNRELDELDSTVDDAVSLLRRGGRIAVIAFHSLEDRIVKHGLRALADRCVCPPRLPICGCGRESLVRILTKRPLRPSADEMERNPRSRSARLRIAEKL